MYRQYMLFVTLFASVCGSFAAMERQKATPLGHPEVIAPTQSKIFENTLDRCRINGTCDLRQIIFHKRDSISPPDEIGLTLAWSDMFAGFVTTDIESLSRYVFVQFTRGCMWDSYLNDDGTIQTEFGVLRNFQGFQRIQHVIPVWTVDSNDTDPVYGSDGAGNRQFFLQTEDAVPAGIPHSQGKLIGEVSATIPFGYITDAPGPATYSPSMKWAKNMSLEYKTCLFRTGDVPSTTLEVEMSLVDKAIDCFDWGSKMVFDHKALGFNTHDGIHAECRRPFTEFERKIHLRQLEHRTKETQE